MLPFINKMIDKNIFIIIDVVSKTYISASFVSLPPQAMLFGMIFKIIQI
jgi:hypothetical protein